MRMIKMFKNIKFKIELFIFNLVEPIRMIKGLQKDILENLDEDVSNN